MTGMNLPEYFFKFLYANGKYFIYVLQIRPAYLHVESSHMRTLHKQSWMTFVFYVGNRETLM